MENDDWSPTYEDLSGPPMAAVRSALLLEQGYVCCYCGRRLPEDLSDGHIDHFWPQAHFNGTDGADLSLDYLNFFRSCGPKGLPGVPKERPTTCGDAKGDWFDQDNYIKPSDEGCEQRFQYGQSGMIAVVDPNDQAAKNMIAVLALNDKALDIEREVILADLEDALRNGEFPVNELARARTHVDGRLPGYGHVVARYLEVEFGLI